MTYTEYLTSLNACQQAIDAAQGLTAQEAWDTCERGDWMLWLAGRLAEKPGSNKRRRLVLAAVECARLAWPYVRAEDKQLVENCYITAEKWGRRESGVTLDDVKCAARAANAAAYAACDVAMLKQCADIVRKHYPISPAHRIVDVDTRRMTVPKTTVSTL